MICAKFLRPNLFVLSERCAQKVPHTGLPDVERATIEVAKKTDQDLIGRGERSPPADTDSRPQ